MPFLRENKKQDCTEYDGVSYKPYYVYSYWHWGRFGSNFAAQEDRQRRTLFGLSLPGGSVVSMYLMKKVKLPLIGRRNFEPWGIILAYKF